MTNTRYLTPMLLLAGAGLLFASSVNAQTVTVGTGSGQPGATVNIPLNYQREGSNVASFDFTFTFNASLYSNVDLSSCGGPVDTQNNTDTTASCNNPNPGEIRVIVSPTSTLPPEVILTQSLGSVAFTIDSGASAPQTDSLTVTDANFFDQTGASVAGSSNDGSLDITTGPQPDIAVTPDPIDFGTVTEGFSDTITVTVDNTGDADLSVSGVSLTGGDVGQFSIPADNCTGSNVAPGASCTFDVQYAPASGTAGTTHTTTTRIQSNDPDEDPFDVTTTGTSATASPEFDENASTTPGTTVNAAGGPGSMPTHNITVANSGTAQLDVGAGSVGSCSFSGANPGVFSTNGVTVPADSSDTLAVSCDLSGASVGDTFTATVSCPTNDSNESPIDWDLSCSAVAPGPTNIPTLSQWGALIAAMTLAVAGGLVLRVRHNRLRA